jgi:hypothetical protein
VTVNYDQAFLYLLELDTTLFKDPHLEVAINKAIDALEDCLDMGLTGEP